MITVSENSLIKPSAAFSVLFWFKTSQSDNGTVFENFHISGTYYGFFVGFSGGNLRILSAKGSGSTAGVDFQQALGPMAVNDGLWHMGVALWDGSYLRCYMDARPGTPVSWSYAPSSTKLYFPYKSYAHIGIRDDSGDEYSEPYSGSLEGLAFLPYALSPSDIYRWFSWSKGRL